MFRPGVRPGRFPPAGPHVRVSPGAVEVVLRWEELSFPSVTDMEALSVDVSIERIRVNPCESVCMRVMAPPA